VPATRIPRPRRGVALPLALAASAALHLALGALAWRARPSAPEGDPVAWLDVELLPAPAPAEVGAPAGPKPPAPPRRRTAAPLPGASRPPSPAPEAGAPAGSVLRAEAGPEPPPPPGAIDLRPRWPGLAPRPDPPAFGPASPGDGPDAWAREQAGRARVEGGLVHPYYGDLGRELVRAWDAEEVVKARGLPGYVRHAGENLRTFGRVWQKLAEGYGRTGAPAAVDGASARLRELSGIPPGPARDALVQREVRRQLRSEFAHGRVALVSVAQAPDGRLLHVELVSPSRDAAIDRAALDGVRDAARKLTPPPEEARGTRGELVSLWEFQLTVSVTPPIPVIEFEFDELLGVADLRLPLDRRVWKQVRLVAVY